MKSFASKKIGLSLVVIIFMAMSTTAFGYTIYVDDNAWGNNDGTTWSNALRSLQDAILYTIWLEGPVEIRVAEGVYKPDQGIGITRRDREMSFFLLSGVTIKGGYAGRSNSNPSIRDVQRYETILSGDLRGNDIEVEYALDLIGAEDRFDNSHNVVYAAEVGETAVLDGFTIRGGYNDNFFGAFGAGMYNGYANPKIRNCTFEDNFAGSAMSMGDGAGMSNYYSNPTLTNCTFRRNCMGYEGDPSIIFPGAPGGGLSNFHSDPELIDCVFDRNVSLDAGGAMFNYDSNPVIINCTFNANVVGAWGGALYNSESSAVMANCQVTLNIAGSGGAVHSESSYMTMTNCTFADNFAVFRGDGFRCDSYTGSVVSSLDFTNCILWDGDDQILNDDGSDIFISYSDIQGGWSGGGTNNVNIDPLFAEQGYWIHIDDTDIVLEPNDPNSVQVDGDYHLKSESGRWDPNSGEWIQDNVTSPCIDAGDPDSPVGDEPEPNGGIINMGAYGGTDKASKSP